MANNNKNNLPLESQTNAQKVKQQNAQANQNASQDSCSWRASSEKYIGCFINRERGWLNC